jgi:site-specific DNA recombinase
MTRKAILYARVSSAAQTDNTSLDGQIDECRKYAREKGFQVVREVKETGSGASADRDGLELAKELGRKGEANSLIVLKTDRFMRGDDAEISPGADAIIAENELKIAGIEVFYVNLPPKGTIEYAMRKMLEHIMASIELETIKKRVWDGKIRGLKNGQDTSGGMAPFGYRRNEDSYLVIVPHEAHVVKEIFKMYVYQGLGYEKIAVELNKDKIPTPSGGTDWNESTVRQIIKREAYTGKYTLMKSSEEPNVTIDVPVIIDEYLFIKAQKTARKRCNSRTKSSYILTGRAVCECGSPMRGHTQRHKKKSGEVSVYRYYGCQHHKGEKAGMVKMEPLENRVREWVFDIFSSKDNLELLAKNVMKRKERDSKPLEDKIHAIALERIETEGKLKRIAKAVINASDIELEVYEPKITSLRKKLNYLERLETEKKAELEQLTASEEEVYNLIRWVSAIDYVIGRKRYDRSFFEKLLRVLDVEVVVLNNREEIELSCSLGHEVVSLGFGIK